MLCYIIIKKNIKNERIVNGISYKEDKEWSGERRGEGGGGGALIRIFAGTMMLA